MSEEQTTAAAETETQAPAAEPIQLGLNDLQACIQIIDVASTRGAFRGEELTAVGGARDRINAFLEANKPAEPAADEAAAATESGDVNAE